MNLQKFTLLLAALFVMSNQLNAQNTEKTDDEQIIAVINDYIVGTSYNYPDKLTAAFMPKANMFLDKDGQPLFVMTIEKYAEMVSANEPGKFNGRTTNILSIDRYQGIAMAKLEVIIPSFERRFIDMLLLKKLDTGWKIISKTAACELSDRQGSKVLIVTSNAANKENPDFSTGNSFSEVAIAYFEYQRAGYHVDFVSPDGGEIPLAYINPNDSIHMAALYTPDFMYAISHTKKPSDIVARDYDIILYTGGSAPIFDIPNNVAIQQIAAIIYQNNGVIAAVCHGTAGIVNIKTTDGQYVVDGKNVNGFPDEFENKKSALYKHFPFIIEEAIENHGGRFQYGEKAKAYHVIDGRLVTGQNYQSSGVVAQKSIEVSKLAKAAN